MSFCICCGEIGTGWEWVCCLNQAVFCLVPSACFLWVVSAHAGGLYVSSHGVPTAVPLRQSPVLPTVTDTPHCPFQTLQAVVPFLALPSQEVELEPWVAIPLLLSLCHRTDSSCQPSAGVFLPCRTRRWGWVCAVGEVTPSTLEALSPISSTTYAGLAQDSGDRRSTKISLVT